jgi:hypothetical protein
MPCLEMAILATSMLMLLVVSCVMLCWVMMRYYMLEAYEPGKDVAGDMLGSAFLAVPQAGQLVDRAAVVYCTETLSVNHPSLDKTSTILLWKTLQTGPATQRREQQARLNHEKSLGT